MVEQRLYKGSLVKFRLGLPSRVTVVANQPGLDGALAICRVADLRVADEARLVVGMGVMGTEPEQDSLPSY